MIPDKIFVNEYQDGYYSPSWWDEKPYEDESIGMKAVCFIRKDVLIEWLQKEYETMSWYDEKMRHVTGCVGDTSSSGKAQAYKSVIDKLNSM